MSADAFDLVERAELAALGDQLDEALRLLQQAESIAGDEPAARADVSERLADVYWQLGRLEQAAAALTGAREWWRLAGNHANARRCDVTLGDLLFEEHRYEDAVGVYESAGATAKLGVALLELGRREEALAVLNQARDEHLREGRPLLAAEVDRTLGEWLLEDGDPDTALDCLQRALSNYRAAGASSWVATTSSDLADALEALGRAAEAETYRRASFGRED